MAESDADQHELAFGRSYIATQYLLGRRDKDLSTPEGLSGAARESCATLVQQLGVEDKGLRARALAPEVATLVKALQQREIA
jgi:hypothetical protein